MPVTGSASTPKWPGWVIIGSFVPFALIALGLVAVFVADGGGVVDTSAEQATFGIGLYLAGPCGLVGIVAGVLSLARGYLKRWLAVAAIVLGTLSLAAGALSWTWFYMVSSFTG